MTRASKFGARNNKVDHKASMIIAQSMSSVTVVHSSPKAHRSWALSALHTSTSQSGRFNHIALTFDTTKERIKKQLSNVEISVSSYDTAWVAMVPSPDSPKSPCFPQSLKWLMDNQLNDGSWGLNPSLIKDNLSSTLACIVALKRWNVGEDQINKGLRFIESNFDFATHENQSSPFGFDIIFPGMLEYAQDLNIKLPIKQTDLSLMLNQRDLKMARFHPNERGAYLAYISEGLRNFHDWNIVMKHQMKNGSLFNSPSATAAALIHNQNAAGLNYLTSLLNKFGNAVPTIYPFDLYGRLSMIDTLERLGISRHFRVEIQNVLDETYRYWVQKDEQIFMDVSTCALAFRLLRINGYEISLDPLAEITNLMNSHEESFKDVYSALEVYKASQIIYEDELTFEEENLKSANFLKQKLSTSAIPSNFHKEVEIALIQVDNIIKFPLITTLERISTRRNIEHYNVDNTRISKTAYRSLNISNEDYLRLAVEDFNACQSIYRGELKTLESWVVENKLDQLKFARQKIAYCYLSVAATLPSPEFSDARICWSKNACFTAMIDDFFDFGGSIDEMVNLMQCIEKWDVDVNTDCCSDDVRIIFLALKGAITWAGETAFKYQERDIKGHIIQIWLDVMKTWLKEAIWARDSYVPTMDEYMENAYVSMALGPIVLPALYFIGPKLSEEIVQSSEYDKLFELVSNQGRLLNDIQTFKLELEQGKLNFLTLRMRKNGKSGILAEEEVAKEIKMFVKSQRREMMKLVIEEKGSVIPRAIKDVFWNMANVMNFYYGTYDGVSGSEIFKNVKEIIYEPVSHPLMLVNGTKQHS